MNYINLIKTNQEHTDCRQHIFEWAVLHSSVETQCDGQLCFEEQQIILSKWNMCRERIQSDEL